MRQTLTLRITAAGLTILLSRPSRRGGIGSGTDTSEGWLATSRGAASALDARKRVVRMEICIFVRGGENSFRC
ncbi:hypothetical protein DE146DRAFT_671584 [Phaeosphaeria sp. MPI-PUGE-AT-0046c]|nr:hypothetical protein DE146DRAFT_671584 [Phaeosphaeria sp. MPI-PUGE-AT-0046c]